MRKLLTILSIILLILIGICVYLVLPSEGKAESESNGSYLNKISHGEVIPLRTDDAPYIYLYKYDGQEYIIVAGFSGCGITKK